MTTRSRSWCRATGSCPRAAAWASTAARNGARSTCSGSRARCTAPTDRSFGAEPTEQPCLATPGPDETRTSREDGRVPRLRVLPALLTLSLLAAACSSDDQAPATGPTAGGSQITAVMASVDLYAGDPQRVAIGLITPDNHFVSFGTVDLAFSMVGSAAEASSPKPGPTTTATFVPTFGTPDRDGGPVVTNPNEGRGVYEAGDVVFDTAGFWVADVTAEVEGLGRQTAQASFAVQERPQLPAPGDRAMKTDTLTVDSTGVPKAAIDSQPRTRARSPTPSFTTGR